MIKLDKLYFSKKAKKEYKFKYDKKNKKRPSWLMFKELPKEVQFIKILINEEAFWYRKYFENYFFPLNNNYEDYENYYDKIASIYDKIVPHNKGIAKFIIKQLSKFKVHNNSSLLEIGAGTGLVSEQIAKAGYRHITLVDISKASLEIAKKRKNLSRCKFIKANLLNFRSDSKVDIVYNSMSLDYFNERELNHILKLTKQNLEKNGFFISIDRHIYKEYKNNFKELDSGWFNLNTKEGKFRYYYFVGKNH